MGASLGWGGGGNSAVGMGAIVGVEGGSTVSSTSKMPFTP